MAKRISEKEKITMISCFKDGKTVDELIEIFNCSRLTIVRNLKKHLGEEKYKKMISISKKSNLKTKSYELKNPLNDSKEFSKENSNNPKLGNNSNELSSISQFTEITPLDYDIENSIQKDLSSVPISDVDLPNTDYMNDDKKIE